MTTIYIVIEFYEDAWSINRAAWTTLELANKDIEDRKAVNALHEEKMTNLINWYYNVYQKEYPLPEHPWEKIKKHPSMESGLGKHQITDAMHAEQKEIDDHNDILIRKYSSAIKRYDEVALVAINSKRVELGLPPKNTVIESIMRRYEPVNYDIEELELRG